MSPSNDQSSLLSLTQLENLMRAGGTQRFHTWAGELLKTQDVAQHVYGLMWLVLALTHNTASRNLLIATIHHDAGERWVGDMPSPTKRIMPGLRDALHEAEADALAARGGVRAPELSGFDDLVLGLADALDGVFFCGRELAMGNRRILPVFENFLEYANSAHVALKEAYPGPLYAKDLVDNILCIFSKLGENND